MAQDVKWLALDQITGKQRKQADYIEIKRRAASTTTETGMLVGLQTCALKGKEAGMLVRLHRCESCATWIRMEKMSWWINVAVALLRQWEDWWPCFAFYDISRETAGASAGRPAVSTRACWLGWQCFWLFTTAMFYGNGSVLAKRDESQSGLEEERLEWVEPAKTAARVK